jgi:hypothetical protein
VRSFSKSLAEQCYDLWQLGGCHHCHQALERLRSVVRSLSQCDSGAEDLQALDAWQCVTAAGSVGDVSDVGITKQALSTAVPVGNWQAHPGLTNFNPEEACVPLKRPRLGGNCLLNFTLGDQRHRGSWKSISY